MRGKKMAKNARHAMRQSKASKPKPTPANDPSLPDLEKKHLITKSSRLVFYDTYFLTPESASERGKNSSSHTKARQMLLAYASPVSSHS